jgi:hypothetical protein
MNLERVRIINTKDLLLGKERHSDLCAPYDAGAFRTQAHCEQTSAWSLVNKVLVSASQTPGKN